MIRQQRVLPAMLCSTWYDFPLCTLAVAILYHCGHFRSRDKDGGHTIRSAVVKNRLLYGNYTALCSIEPDLLPIEVLHCGNMEVSVFLQEKLVIVKNILVELFLPGNVIIILRSDI